ncbi:MAG: hypothetical protein ACPG4X_20400 [Pikeienuella sp.]
MIENPDDLRKYVDEGGTFNEEFYQWLLALVAEVNALRTEVDDHEGRIVALEP